MSKTHIRLLTQLGLLCTITLLCPFALAEGPQVSRPAFTVPAQTFTAPIQTGTARSAHIDTPGLYKVPDDVKQIYCLGRELPLLGERLVFVPTVDDFYTGGNSVWAGTLSFQGGPGTLPPPTPQATLEEDGAFIAVCRAEQDEDFQHNYLKEVAPNWYFGKSSNIIGTRRDDAGERVPNPINVALSLPAPKAQGTAELRIALNSDAPPGKANSLSVTVNGTPLQEAANWAGPGYQLITFTLDSALLRDGENTIGLLGDSDYVKHLDWVEVAAPAQPRLRDGGLIVLAKADASIAIDAAKFAVDITDFGAETSMQRAASGYPLKSGRLYYFSDKSSPLEFGPERKLALPVSETVDYLAVGPAAALSALEPLLKKKQEAGMTTAAAALEDILAVYNNGLFGPEGLRAMLSGVKPKYLLIAGGFDRDCRRRQENHRANPKWQRGVPAYMRQLEQLTVTDDPYTLNNSIKVGRVPLDDAEAIGSWAKKAARHAPADSMVLLAGSNKDYDFSASQARQNPGVRAALLCAEGQPQDEVRRKLFRLMKSGAPLCIYQGHAQSWELDKGLLKGSNASEIPASSWLLATCNAGYYQGDFEVYLRDWMRAPSGGCVNALAASSIGTAGDQDQLIRQFLFHLQSEPDTDWGGAMNHLKRNLPFNEKTMNDPNLPDFVKQSIEKDRLTIDAYSLFGDPAARVTAPMARTAKFENRQGGDAALKIEGSWEAKALAAGQLAIEWRPMDSDTWKPLKLSAPLTPGATTISLKPEDTGTDGGRFEVRLVENQEGLPPFVWARTKIAMESVQPGVPKVMLRQQKQNQGAEAGSIMLVARDAASVHSHSSLETQFEVRDKKNLGASSTTDWLEEQRYRYATSLPLERLEARARCRKNGITGEWSQWYSAETPAETPEVTP